jgi:hypothetical protein
MSIACIHKETLRQKTGFQKLILFKGNSYIPCGAIWRLPNILLLVKMSGRLVCLHVVRRIFFYKKSHDKKEGSILLVLKRTDLFAKIRQTTELY